MQAHLATQRACEAAGDVLVLELKLKRRHLSDRLTKTLVLQKTRKTEQVRRHMEKTFQWVSHGQKLTPHVPPTDCQHGLVDDRRLLALQVTWVEVSVQTVQSAVTDLSAMPAARSRLDAIAE
jgi:hypothetical protein